jgi:hypothetical protein
MRHGKQMEHGRAGLEGVNAAPWLDHTREIAMDATRPPSCGTRLAWRPIALQTNPPTSGSWLSAQGNFTTGSASVVDGNFGTLGRRGTKQYRIRNRAFLGAVFEELTEMSDGSVVWVRKVIEMPINFPWSTTKAPNLVYVGMEPIGHECTIKLSGDGTFEVEKGD